MGLGFVIIFCCCQINSIRHYLLYMASPPYDVWGIGAGPLPGSCPTQLATLHQESARIYSSSAKAAFSCSSCSAVRLVEIISNFGAACFRPSKHPSGRGCRVARHRVHGCSHSRCRLSRCRLARCRLDRRAAAPTASRGSADRWPTPADRHPQTLTGCSAARGYPAALRRRP